MNLRKLSLNNYGLFRGQHHIDLSTKRRKPIVLFGGKNGSGKTTILEAIHLCLYGAAALGARLSKDTYSGLLAQRIHSSAALLVQPTFASVSLTFEHADVGRVCKYEVCRSWERAVSGRISEELKVTRDDQELSDLTAEQWQDFVRELIPPGVSRLFFFDGEKIQQLAEDTSDQLELASSIKALLGTDVIERLQADLSIYRTRMAKTVGRADGPSEFEMISGNVAECEGTIRRLDDRRMHTEARLSEIRNAITRVEHQIAAEGGAFTRNRDSHVTKREEARAAISMLEHSLRQLCQGLLPFSLASNLCRELRNEILREDDAQRSAVGRTLLEEVRTDLLSRIDSGSWLPIAVKMPAKPLAMLTSKLRETVQATLNSRLLVAEDTTRTRKEQIHHLSGTESRQLLQWIDGALSGLPERVKEIAEELESQYRNLQRAEEALKRIPSDDVLAPLVAELQSLNQLYGELSAKGLSESDALRVEQSRLADFRRRLASEAQKLSQEATDSNRIGMISKIQASLDEFRDTLLARKVVDLETSVRNCLNTLSRKSDSVRRVSINPKTFGVILYDHDSNPLPKDRLSAGEKQIYAIAMLWALARTSGRPLPVIIDTPLGRLDSDHRRLLVERYFPYASHQVIVLSTDTEVDTMYFELLKPFIGSAYQIDYNMNDRCSTVKEGYFLKEAHEAHQVATH